MNARRTRKPLRNLTQKPSGPAEKSVSTRGYSKPCCHMKPASSQQKSRKVAPTPLVAYIHRLRYQEGLTVAEVAERISHETHGFNVRAR